MYATIQCEINSLFMTNSVNNKLLPLAKRYSDAIVAVAKDRGELDEVFADLGTVSESLDLVAKMKDFLMHPVIPFAEKKDMIKSVFQGRVKDSTLSLMFILTEKNRLNLLDTIKYCSEESMDEAQNSVKVDVVSAVEIDGDLKQSLKERLENKLHKAVKFVFDINPDIIAGLILKIQDKTIDGSMAAKIEGFKKILR